MTSSVLPTPVGPTKINDAGLRRELICTRLRRIAAEVSFIASSCPIIFLLSFFSRLESLESSLSHFGCRYAGPKLNNLSQIVVGYLNVGCLIFISFACFSSFISSVLVTASFS